MGHLDDKTPSSLHDQLTFAGARHAGGVYILKATLPIMVVLSFPLASDNCVAQWTENPQVPVRIRSERLCLILVLNLV
jgi:hypothetical protein